ncbi:histidinol-phosphate aminotransferase family protein [Thermococcus sp. MV5]|uniref:pyridoxal phosphate-dependent aminotransferase n=1 Tax=Thermococcus sp. MV5 TaxID=1638272 RepID=UPI00143A185D|nr:histidinol-phosphate transaminase [Thermococcus sp. MV5]NJE26177.1 histidinol-phosphate aminotransferase family protein [Thermococcus sp. MV5]
MIFEAKFRKSLFEVERESYVKENLPMNLLDCSLGTNPYGFPKEILKEIKLESTNLSKYPSPYNDVLRETLVEYWGGAFSKNEVFIGVGSMGCLEKINKFAISQGSHVLGYVPQFQEYITEVKIMGGIYDYVALKEENDFEFSPDELIEKIKYEHVLIYIDNPNNPTGQVIPLDSIEEIVKKAASKDVIVVVDEAYGDFVDKKNSAINLNYPNLMVVRSFSKGLGLANLRIGYVVIKGMELRELYSKVNLPFQVSTLAEKIALKVLEHPEFLKESIKKISKEKRKIIDHLKKVGFNVAKTEISVPILLASKKGIDTYNYLLQRGVLTVSGENFLGLDSSYVRIRVSEKAEAFIERL